VPNNGQPSKVSKKGGLKAALQTTESGNLTMLNYDGFRVPKSNGSIDSSRTLSQKEIITTVKRHGKNNS